MFWSVSFVKQKYSPTEGGREGGREKGGREKGEGGRRHSK